MTTSLMSLGSQAMFAAYAQLQTTGNNIANANTPGYSRQSAQLSTQASQYTGRGYIGQGVTVATVVRASNMFLSQQAVAAKSAAATDGARSAMLSQLEKAFPGGESGLGQAVTQIFNAFGDVAAAPSDLSARQAVLGRLQEFASLARSSSDQVESLAANVRADVAGGVDTVNTLAEQLAKLNARIAVSIGSGQPPNDLLDQRDQIVGRIAEQLQVHTYIGADEQVSVFVGSGQTLVQGGIANALSVQADNSDPRRIDLAIEFGGQPMVLSADSVGEGHLAGLLRFQDSDLADTRIRLNDLVAGVVTALNAQQSFGLDLAGRGAGVFDASGTAVDAVPLFDFDAGNAAHNLQVRITNPRDLAAASPVSAVAATGNSGTVAVTSLQVQAVPASAYPPLTLSFSQGAAGIEVDLIDADGLSVLPAGKQPYVAGASIVQDGLSITLAGAPRAGDTIVLAPTTAPAASNGNALAFDALATRALVLDSHSGASQTATDAFANLLGDVGVRVQGAVTAADTSATVSATATAELSGKTGVNLDEEAARLIQYQQSYQAAAKMLQTAQTLMDTMLNIVR
jgi:flagellar hook-associated protein 1 FlgK